MTALPFVRPLKEGDKGPAVEAAKRAVYRCLNDPAKWKGFTGQKQTQRRTFGPFFTKDLALAQNLVTAGKPGVFDEPTLRSLEGVAFDQLARKLWLQQFPAPLELCYPLLAGRVCQGLHETSGLAGNWAVDFCAPPGTTIVAPEKATVVRLSGHDPNEDTWDSQGVFGWTTYLLTPQHYTYFITHEGSRSVRVGQTVMAGEPVGKVGDQKFRPDHAHVGVSSPLGPTDAKKRILAVSTAPRIDI